MGQVNQLQCLGFERRTRSVGYGSHKGYKVLEVFNSSKSEDAAKDSKGFF